MELEIKAQAVRLGLALLLGLCTGLIYDLLRPVRRRAGRAAVLLDILFSAAVFVLSFLFAMGAGSGRLGQWELCGILLGFLSYMHFLSVVFFPIFERTTALLIRGIRLCKKLIKKAGDSSKFFFKNMRKCFIIKR